MSIVTQEEFLDYLAFVGKGTHDAYVTRMTHLAKKLGISSIPNYFVWKKEYISGVDWQESHPEINMIPVYYEGPQALIWGFWEFSDSLLFYLEMGSSFVPEHIRAIREAK